MSRIVYFHFFLCFRQTFGIFSQDVWNIPSLSETAVHIQPLLYFTLLYWTRSPQWLNPLHYPSSPWKVVPHHRGLRPLLFTNSSMGSFMSHKNQNSERAVRRGQRFSFLFEKTKGFLVAVHFLAIACILRKRVVYVTGSNIFPNKHLWQIPRWRRFETFIEVTFCKTCYLSEDVQ